MLWGRLLRGKLLRRRLLRGMLPGFSECCLESRRAASRKTASVKVASRMPASAKVALLSPDPGGYRRSGFPCGFGRKLVCSQLGPPAGRRAARLADFHRRGYPPHRGASAWLSAAPCGICMSASRKIVSRKAASEKTVPRKVVLRKVVSRKAASKKTAPRSATRIRRVLLVVAEGCFEEDRLTESCFEDACFDEG